MTVGRLAERARLSPGATTTVRRPPGAEGPRPAHARHDRPPPRPRRGDPELRRMGEQLHGSPEEGGEALSVYTDEQLEFLTEFLRGNVAYQEERMRRLEELKVAETG